MISRPFFSVCSFISNRIKQALLSPFWIQIVPLWSLLSPLFSPFLTSFLYDPLQYSNCRSHALPPIRTFVALSSMICNGHAKRDASQGKCPFFLIFPFFLFPTRRFFTLRDRKSCRSRANECMWYESLLLVPSPLPRCVATTHDNTWARC